MQHGAVDVACAVQGIRRCGDGQAGARAHTGRRFRDGVPDAGLGASGIIAPMVNTVEDARAFASSRSFRRSGERSWGPAIAMELSGLGMREYLAGRTSSPTALAMIETREALAALDDILAVPGIDGVFVGPSDLSIALSNGAHVDAGHKDVWTRSTMCWPDATPCGKRPAVFAMTASARRPAAAGAYDLIALSNDVMQLRPACRR